MKQLDEEEFKKAYLNKWTDEILFVVAYTFEEANRWRSKHNYPIQFFRYVSSVEKLKGVRHGKILFISGWSRRDDATLIAQETERLLTDKRLTEVQDDNL